jgi:hypothetical protein
VDASLRDRQGRCRIVRAARPICGVDNVGDLLIDLELNRHVRIDVWQNLEDYAGIVQLDRIDNRGIGTGEIVALPVLIGA